MDPLLDPTEKEDAFSKSIPSLYPWLAFDHDSTARRTIVPIQDYPVLRGWSKFQLDSLRQCTFVNTHPASALSMLQSWLFFGVLESALQEYFPTSLFLGETVPLDRLSAQNAAWDLWNPGSDPRRLDTSYLVIFLKEWTSKSPHLSKERIKMLSKSLVETILVTQDWITFMSLQLGPRTVEFHTGGELAGPFNSTLRSSILLLDFLVQSFAPQIGSSFLPRELGVYDFDPDEEIHRSLEKEGWCPSSFSLLSSQLGLSGLLYALSLGPSELLDVSHTTCSENECRAYDVDAETYVPSHGCETDDCGMVLPPIEQIYQALRDSTFPLVNGKALLANDASACEPVIVPYSPGTPFVAFSHVWSDGHGSVPEEGLPRCQLEFLTRLVDLTQLGPQEPPHLFWIDSLCIPRNVEFRAAAIHQMATIYRSATTTVVLDTRLRCVSSKQPITNICFRLITSVWMRRTWTLQEGLLSNDLRFLIKDTLITTSHLFSWIFESAYVGPISLRAITILSPFHGVKASSKAGSLVLILDLLKSRKSSRLDDETLAIAPLVNVDVKMLTPLSGEDRMLQFWDCLELAPVDILFSSTERLSLKGRRWAPKRLSTAYPSMLGSSLGQITQEGLVGDFTLLELSFCRYLKRNTRYTLCDSGARTSAFLQVPSVSLPSDNITEADIIPCDAITLQYSNLQASYNPCLFLRKESNDGLLKTAQHYFEITARGYSYWNNFENLIDWEKISDLNDIHAAFNIIEVQTVRKQIIIT